MRTSNQSGVTMIEFAITSVIFIGLIGAIFDFGVGLSNYSHLTFITQQAVRQGAITEDQSNCFDLQSTVCGKAQELRDGFGHDSTWADFRFKVKESNTAQGVTTRHCSAVLSGTYLADCFLCLFYPGPLTLKVSSEQIIEDRVFCENLGNIGIVNQCPEVICNI